MESTPETPEKKYGGYIMALLLVGFLGTLVILQGNWSEAESEAKQASDWIALDDGSGVEYQQLDDIVVLYRNMLSDTHRVFAYVDKLGFTGVAQWKTDCEEGTEIETSRTFSSGEPKMLKCVADGWLRMTVFWPDGEPVRWKDDFDGFEVDVDFREWDFTKGRQFMTLQKAKRPDAKDG